MGMTPEPTTDKRLRTNTCKFLQRDLLGDLRGDPAESIRAELVRFGLFVQREQSWDGERLYYLEAEPDLVTEPDRIHGSDRGPELAAERISRAYLEATE